MSGTADKSPKDTFDELKVMVIDYAKQETVDPLRHLGRWLAFGFAGGLCIAIGIILLGLGALRAIQTQATSTFDGSFTWAPYLIVFVILALAIALLIRAAQKQPIFGEGND